MKDAKDYRVPKSISLQESLWEALDEHRETLPGPPNRSVYIEWLLRDALERQIESKD